MEQQDQNQGTNGANFGVGISHDTPANSNSELQNQKQTQQPSQYNAPATGRQSAAPASATQNVQTNSTRVGTTNLNNEQVKVRPVARESLAVNAQAPNRVPPSATQAPHGASQEHNSQSIGQAVQSCAQPQATNDVDKPSTTNEECRTGFEGEILPPPNFEGPVQAEVPYQIELPPHQKDWEDAHWDAFSHYFNKAANFSELQKKCNNARKEKIALLVIRAESKGYEIDKGRKAKWLASDEDSRGRCPIVEVCKGDYIRISAKLAEQFGVKLKEGQKYILSASPEDGKAKIELEELV